MEKIRLQQLFSSTQKEMSASFDKSACLIHPSDKGDGTELTWIDWFNEYFPRRYKAMKATIIDYKGNCSNQIDMVIYDDYYSPLIFESNGIKYIPIEAVYGVFEIKQEINATYIEYASKKIKSVRSLEITSAPVPQIDGSLKSKAVKYRIMGGILAPKMSWSNKNPKKPLLKSLKNNCTSADCQLDMIVALNYFSAFLSYGEKGDISFERFDEKDVLFEAYFNLLRALQRIGNLPAIDYDKYRG